MTEQHLTHVAIQFLLSWGYFIPVASLFCYVLYQRFLSPLANIPGPFLASVTKLWLIRASRSGQQHEIFRDLHRRYGKVVRIAPNELTFSDPKALTPIYGLKSRCHKSTFYQPLKGSRHFDLFGEQNEQVHTAQRRLVSRSYGPHEIRQLESYVDETVKFFFKRMEDLRNGSIDMGLWLQLFAFDVIGEITFSKSFGFMEAGNDNGTFDSIRKVQSSASWTGQIPWIVTLQQWLKPIIGNHLDILNRNTYWFDFGKKQVDAYRDRGSEHSDLMTQFMAIKEKAPQQFNEMAVISMCTQNITAGSDTTAATLRSVVYFVLKNPIVQEKLVRELQEAWEQGKLSNPIKQTEVDHHLPYFKAVVNESLRLFPVVGVPLGRIVPPEGITIDDKFYLGGTTVSIVGHAMHEDEEVFGDDARLFNPDRWFRDNSAAMHHAIFTWGSGARMCIGKNIAQMEIAKLLSTLFLRYKVSLTDPQAVWHLKTYLVTSQENLHVKLQPNDWAQ